MRRSLSLLSTLSLSSSTIIIIIIIVQMFNSTVHTYMTITILPNITMIIINNSSSSTYLSINSSSTFLSINSTHHQSLYLSISLVLLCVYLHYQGRCTLLSALMQQQIMMLESCIAAYTLSALSLHNARSSERQMMVLLLH